MRLDISRLEKVKRNADRSITCRCPICAESGHDTTGNHLRVWVTGAFSCVTNQGDRRHNSQIKAYLCNTAPSDNPDIEYIDPEPTIKVDKVYPESSLISLLPQYDYWVNRGARPEVLRALEGGLAPLDEKSKLSGRFIFPIRGLDGRINGFTGRLVAENSFAPTWKHLFRSSKSVWPWNVSGSAIRASRTVVLVESVGDCLALLSNGVPNVLCIFGLNLNGKIISTLIANDVRKVIVSLNRDDDPSKGQRAAEKIANRLAAFYSDGAVVIRLPPEGVNDWGEATSEQITAFRTELAVL